MCLTLLQKQLDSKYSYSRCVGLSVISAQVEDMLKRSFAEFHAQRAAPEAIEGLRLGQQRLAALRARPWPSSFLGTTREAVEQYFALSQRIEALSVELQVPAHSLAVQHACSCAVQDFQTCT